MNIRRYLASTFNFTR